jgi:hypothetical protein
MISNLNTIFNKRDWLTAFIAIAFVCCQAIAQSHTLEHTFAPPGEHQESSCSACAAADHSPATGTASYPSAALYAASMVASTYVTAAQNPHVDRYRARAPPPQQ